MLVTVALALLGAVVARRMAEREVDLATAQANVAEARTHYARILPLMRNWHNAEAALELRAVVGHLEVAGRAARARDAELERVLGVSRGVASQLTGQGTGVPANTAEALVGLEGVMGRLEVGKGGGVVRIH